MRLLFVEDNIDLAEYTKSCLERESFAVDWFDNANDALHVIGNTRYDALILDLGLPDMDGMDVLRKIRTQYSDLPILILTARDSIQDRVAGLNDGADDYLLKPFEMSELLARIKALLRRPGGALGLVLKAGNLIYDTVGREVSVGGITLNLSRREMDMLEQLMRRKGRGVPKGVIEESIYGFGSEVASNTIEVAMHRLRKRLEKSKAAVEIHTIRGVGYILQENSS